MNKKSKILLLVLILLLFSFRICSSVPNTYDYRNFKNMIQQFLDYSIVGDGGTFYTYPDYSKAYANINQSIYKTVGVDYKNFALSMNVSWESASETPNTATAGCGLIFRFNTSEAVRLSAILRMDGNLTYEAHKYGERISFQKYYYGRANIEATHNLTVVANGSNVNIFIDGMLYANVREVPITRSGTLALLTVSGTNKDWGTRCEFTNINFYVW